MTSNAKGQIILSSGAKLITFTPDGENGGHFALSSEISDTAWISLTDFADVNEDDLYSFSADRISVSEPKSGEKVILYTRVWNETEKKI